MKARFLYALPTLVFLVFAALQYNDPDPLYWMGIYGFVAVANVLAMFNKLHYIVVILGFALLLLLITNSFQTVDEWNFDTEEGREIFGLIISCNWMGLMGILKLYNDAYK